MTFREIAEKYYNEYPEYYYSINQLIDLIESYYINYKETGRKDTITNMTHIMPHDEDELEKILEEWYEVFEK